MSAKKRVTPFNEAHGVEYGLEILSRSATTTTTTKEVASVRCRFCIAFGREGSSSSSPSSSSSSSSSSQQQGEGQGVRRRRRMPTARVKHFTKPFRVDNYKSHLKGQHATKWNEYKNLSSPEQKKAFFDTPVEQRVNTPDAQPYHHHHHHHHRRGVGTVVNNTRITQPPPPPHHHDHYPPVSAPPPTDLLCQWTTAYAHWKTGRAGDHSVFELFFQGNPFGGGGGHTDGHTDGHTVFCGLGEVLNYLKSGGGGGVGTFRFSESDIAYLRSVPSLSHCEDAFFDYLANINIINNINKNNSKNKNKNDSNIDIDSDSNVDRSGINIKISAVAEGTIVFPRTPVITVEGPLLIGNLLETTLLNLINFPSLIATNASRMVLRAAERRETRSQSQSKRPQQQSQQQQPQPQPRQIPCIESGLRGAARGPDRALTASKYSYIGGFSGTTNVRAGREFGIPITGTHAHSHSFVRSFSSSSLWEAEGLKLFHKIRGRDEALLNAVLRHRRREAIENNNNNSNNNSNNGRKQQRSQHQSATETTTTTNIINANANTNDSELAAFTAYACAFPDNFLCLIDTYDTLRSGIWNFVFVAKALDDFGYRPRGVRLDSGDLVGLSNSCKAVFDSVVSEDPDRAEAFGNLAIIAGNGNDINEKVLHGFSEKDHSLTAFGIGTGLVTRPAQPALGCAYKLVEYRGAARVEFSDEIAEVTLPGRKSVYRLYTTTTTSTTKDLAGEKTDAEGKAAPSPKPVVDYMTLAEEEAPTVATASGEGILCRDPFDHRHRIRVFPTRVVPLQSVVFVGGVGDGGDGNGNGNGNGNSAIGGPQKQQQQQQYKPAPQTTCLADTREYVKGQLFKDFAGTGVTDYKNPTKYNVMVSPLLYKYLHELWEKNAPIPELR